MIASLGSMDLAAVALIILVAACAQMVSGFGFALMAVPLMGLAIDLKTAVVISTICGTASNTFQAVTGSHHREGQLVKVLVVSSFIGMPFGVILLDRVNAEVLQVVIGCVVLVALMAVVMRPVGRAVGGTGLEIGAGFLSGVLATSTSTNGPPLVLLLRSRGLSPDRFRATINSVFSIVAVTTVLVFAASGRFTVDVATGSLVGLPGLVIGMMLGSRLRGLLSVDVFWRIVLGLLVVTASSSIVSGLV